MHLDISVIRTETQKVYPNLAGSSLEDLAWTILRAEAYKHQNCIVESTGTIYRLQHLWTTQLVSRGIYTIKFVAPVEICQKRAQERARNPVKGYDLDESYAILADEEFQDRVPANLIVDMTSFSNIEEKFEEIKWHILRAMKCFETYKAMGIARVNQLKEKK